MGGWGQGGDREGACPKPNTERQGPQPVPHRPQPRRPVAASSTPNRHKHTRVCTSRNPQTLLPKPLPVPRSSLAHQRRLVATALPRGRVIHLHLQRLQLPGPRCAAGAATRCAPPPLLVVALAHLRIAGGDGGGGGAGSHLWLIKKKREKREKRNCSQARCKARCQARGRGVGVVVGVGVSVSAGSRLCGGCPPTRVPNPGSRHFPPPPSPYRASSPSPG